MMNHGVIENVAFETGLSGKVELMKLVPSGCMFV